MLQSPYRTLQRPSILKGESYCMFINDTLLKMTTDLTTATLSNSAIRVDAASGEQVADFMQKIYEKLVELNDNDSN